MRAILLVVVILSAACIPQVRTVVHPMCLPVQPTTPSDFYCYPVDVHSGQQMCVRQLFNEQE